MRVPIRSFWSGPNALLVMALAAGLFVLLAAATIGARRAQDAEPTSRARTTASEVTDTSPGDTSAASETPAPDAVGGTAAPSSSTSKVGKATVRATTAPTGGTAGGAGAGAPASVQVPGSREGIYPGYFKYGIHAPLTIDGAPLNLAEDPITGFKGYITYVNRQGGVNGRKVKVTIADDRYTTDGGAQARDILVKETKPFFISGTLGVDQIAIVAKAAGEAKIPYMGGGGPEPEWKNIGMFQLLSSYDQYASILTQYICKEGQAYVGDAPRIGITTLDSPYIRPVEARFVNELKSRCGIVVDPKARGYVQKPTQQTSYTQQALDLKSAYGGKGANLLVPLQDPITTSRQVAEWKTQGYQPKWNFANFAHDGDTVLTLMAGDWTGVRGLSGACYYQAANAFNPAFCANMKTAHDEWLALGHVDYDENAGGGTGGHSSYDYTQPNWDTDGSGGSSGYQLVHFWLTAMKAIGADPTREKFVAALSAYDNFSDLITGPISFKGSPNIMHGAAVVSVIEGQSNQKYKQLTPGLVDHF